MDLRVDGEVTWDPERFGEKPGVINEVVWPLGLSLNNDVILATVARSRDTASGRPGLAAIWWLRLDPTHRRIVDGAPILERGGDPADQRHPAVIRDASGTNWIAFLHHGNGQPRAEIHTAVLDADLKSNTVQVRPGTERQVAVLGSRAEPIWADHTATSIVYAVPNAANPNGLPVIERIRVGDSGSADPTLADRPRPMFASTLSGP
jgi:hypothetical protein